uniref:Uncharacterized protein n=1 Tax=Cacopsylla melanoneura TaxID=428564 RepID=A0A8D8WDD1_9HEMI
MARATTPTPVPTPLCFISACSSVLTGTKSTAHTLRTTLTPTFSLVRGTNRLSVKTFGNIGSEALETQTSHHKKSQSAPSKATPFTNHSATSRNLPMRSPTHSSNNHLLSSTKSHQLLSLFKLPPRSLWNNRRVLNSFSRPLNSNSLHPFSLNSLPHPKTLLSQFNRPLNYQEPLYLPSSYQ